MGLFTAFGATTGTFTGITFGTTAGCQVNGTAVFCGGNPQNVQDLAANVTCLAESATMTITPKWQTSSDNSTWVDATSSNSPTNVAIATGTTAADSAVSRTIAAPGVLASNYVRLALVCGVSNGASQDTYTISYNYRDPSC